MTQQAWSFTLFVVARRFNKTPKSYVKRSVKKSVSVSFVVEKMETN